jgi:methionyl-tRNA synthetase
VVPRKGAPTAEDEAVLAAASEALDLARKAMAGQAIHQALAAVIAVVAEADRYFAGQAPWGLKKTDPARMETVLWTTAEVVRRIAIMLQPYVPGSAAKLLDLLDVPADKRLFAHAGDADALVPGTPLPAPAGVFPRYVEQEATGG